MPRTITRKPPRTAAEELTRVFTATGLSVAEAARRVNVSRALFTAYLAGRSVPSYDRAVTMLAILTEDVRPSVSFFAHRDEVRALLAGAGVTGAAVVGSVATGTDGVDSDLDLLLRYDPNTPADLLTLEEELTDLLAVPVDLLDENLTDPAFAARLLDTHLPV